MIVAECDAANPASTQRRLQVGSVADGVLNWTGDRVENEACQEWEPGVDLAPSSALSDFWRA
jgi:hypothetical protein